LIVEKGVRFLTVKAEKIAGLEARAEDPRKGRILKKRLKLYLKIANI
jgi:hypothetical protein